MSLDFDHIPAEILHILKLLKRFIYSILLIDQTNLGSCSF
ncbi:hypothetical protein P872_13385 [Rhodonellum psychrophilum GCM71 = DSM 17998]|uniref:Uncharacterized protein n=1 Tax=Rhodonellum psychrophilum GCM71 = DSM 17998 TaxID=1123057 RepID=U5BIZ4_9BACT|nr:hypothetical protein P872_13385 [Rhodonellum psychrophilum GCM71 = DSM 17998]